MYELECKYDSRNSFYKKAMVGITYDAGTQIATLYSYGVKVGRVERSEESTIYYYYGKYSQTTTRHQKEFFKQEGLDDNEIKQLFKDGIFKINL